LKKPTEKHIEVYCKYPYLLLNEEKKWIEYWIETDIAIKQISDFYKRFYSTFKKVEEKRSVKSGVIVLTHKIRKKKQHNGFVLAAESLSVGSYEAETVKTFVSEEHNTVLRLINKPNKHQCVAYVLRELGAEDDIYLLQKENNQDFLISEPGGKFIIDTVKNHSFDLTEWQSCWLFIPIVQLLVYRDENNGNLTFSFNNTLNTDFVEVSFINDQLEIEILYTPNEKSLSKVILKSGSEVELYILNSSRITFSVIKFVSNTSYINFYN